MSEEIVQKKQVISAPVKKQPEQLESVEIISQLNDYYKKIQEARGRLDKKNERLLYLAVADTFNRLFNEDIFKIAEKEAKEELVSEGHSLSNKKKVFSEEDFRKQVEIFRAQQQTFGLEKGWEALTEEEKKAYQNDMAIFVTTVEKKRNDLSKIGINVYKEVFYNMISGKYKFPKIETGFWMNKVIRIPVLNMNGFYKGMIFSKTQFLNMINGMQDLFDSIAIQAVKENFNNRVFAGRRRWLERKKRKIREIILRKIKEFESEEKMKDLVESRIQDEILHRVKNQSNNLVEEAGSMKEEEVLKRLQNIEHVNKKTDIDMRRELEKVTKNISKEIKHISEEERKIKKIIKASEKKREILPQKTAYLKSLEEDKNDKNI